MVYIGLIPVTLASAEWNRSADPMVPVTGNRNFLIASDVKKINSHNANTSISGFTV